MVSVFMNAGPLYQNKKWYYQKTMFINQNIGLWYPLKFVNLQKIKSTIL